jgi:hypothetical protein
MNEQQMDCILKQLLSCITNSGGNNQSTSLVNAIDRLTAAIVDLQRCISSICVSNLNTNKSNSPLSNTYAQALSKNNTVNTKNSVAVNNTTSIQNNDNISKTNINTTNNTVTDTAMLKIIETKNKRNDAFYKWQRNKLVANVYENNLSQQPQRIPKKYAPKVNRNDANDIILHKTRVAAQSVQNEIETLRIHETLQYNKVCKLDAEVRELIAQKECEESQRNSLLRKYEIIIGRHDNNTLRRLNDKVQFFCSPANTVTLNYKLRNDQINSTNTAIPTNIREDTDIDDISESEMDLLPQSSNAQKRRMSSHFSGLSPPSKIVNAVPSGIIPSNVTLPMLSSKSNSATVSRRSSLRSAIIGSSAEQIAPTVLSQPLITALSQPATSVQTQPILASTLPQMSKNSQIPVSKTKMKSLSQG